MFKMLLSVIVVILLIWIVVEYMRWKKGNKIEEDLESSRHREGALRKRAKTLQINLKNRGISKALFEIEEDMLNGRSLRDMFEEVEKVVEPKTGQFTQEYEADFGSSSDKGSDV